MLLHFFYTLRRHQLPVSIREFLTLLDAFKHGLIDYKIDDFYQLARLCLVKDEIHFDKFDRAFSEYFQGIQTQLEAAKLPEDWLLQKIMRELTPEQFSELEKLGLDELMKRLSALLDEQKERHEGGNKWIGTGGSSPFGNGGTNPQGIRIGGKSQQKRALKVWEQRQYRDYDDQREIGTRNIKMALRRLRKFTRLGMQDEFALDATINATAHNAGLLDIRMQAPRKNEIKVLMLLDVGGTMDEHVLRTEELFSAAKSEFKHLNFYYFHNCVYDFVWKNNQRRYSERTSTYDLIRTYPADTRLVLVGDATMSPYEILQPGGSVEYPNEEAGAEWIQRLLNHFPKHAWLNPEPEGIWQYRQSIDILQKIMRQKMYPFTLQGLDAAMKILAK